MAILAVFSRLFSVSASECRNGISITPRPLPSQCFHIHHSSYRSTICRTCQQTVVREPPAALLNRHCGSRKIISVAAFFRNGLNLKKETGIPPREQPVRDHPHHLVVTFGSSAGLATTGCWVGPTTPERWVSRATLQHCVNLATPERWVIWPLLNVG
jgi:hypothetical protein